MGFIRACKIISICAIIHNFHEISVESSSSTTWFDNSVKDCVYSSLGIQRKNYDYVWTVGNFQDYFDIVKRFNLEKTLTQQISSGGINVESTMHLKRLGEQHTDSKLRLITRLVLQLPWILTNDIEVKAKLTICTHLGNFSVPIPPTLRTVVNPRSSIMSFTWDNIDSDELYHIADLGSETGSNNEINLVYNVVRFEFVKDSSTKKCPNLGNLTSMSHEEGPHSAFRHG